MITYFFGLICMVLLRISYVILNKLHKFHTYLLRIIWTPFAWFYDLISYI